MKGHTELDTRTRLVAWAGWALIALCLAWSVTYGFSYLRIVSEPHAYEQASRWMYRHIPPGSRILNVHWDDHLPITLPGLSPERFHYQVEGRQWELPLYEPESPNKLGNVSAQLADADYLVFPTARIPGSIPRRPDEYPQTLALIQLLFSEKLGYHIVHVTKVNPGIGAWEFPDSLADESISVYDHPAAIIFSNVERLSAQQIEERVQSADAFGPLLSREEILDIQGGLAPKPFSRPLPQVLQVILWLAALEVVTFVGWPILAVLFFRLPDNGFGLAKIGGLVMIAYLTWLLHRFGVITPAPAAGWLVVLIVGVGSLLVLSWNRLTIPELLRATHGECLRTNLCFWGAFLSIALLRFFQPEIFWGEKPMDFTFLNYFTRVETLPPSDPWAAGSTMNYYYFGVYALSLLHKLSGVDTAIGYNLSIATIGAWSVAALYSLFRAFSRSIVWSAIGAFAIVYFSNFEWVRLAFVEGKAFNFDMFWASTRLFNSPAFAEYPWWSLLFADVHAHVIAQPVFILFTAVLAITFLGDRYECYDDRFSRATFFGRIAFLGLCMGILFMMNTWDFMSACGGAFLFGGGAFLLPWVNKEPWVNIANRWKTLAVGFVLLAGVAALTIYPFVLGVPSAFQVHFGWVTQEEFNNLSQVLRHLGLWIIPMLFGVVFFLTFDSGDITWRSSLIAGAVGLIPLALALWSAGAGNRQLPWDIVGSSAVLVCLSGMLTFRRDRAVSLFGWCGVCIGLVIPTVELVFLIDRMNTIFKFYSAVWIVGGIGAVIAASLTYERLVAVAARAWDDRILKAAWFVIPVCGLVAATGSVIFAGVIGSFSRVNGPRYTLDGMAYLDKQNPSEAKLMRWMRANITGTPVVLEAWGISYGPYTRISMNTGLPTILGWEHHVKQRGLLPQEVPRRRRLIESIYRGANMEETAQLLKQNKIEYVVIGDLERTTYGASLLDRWLSRTDLFNVVWQEGNTALLSAR